LGGVGGGGVTLLGMETENTQAESGRRLTDTGTGMGTNGKVKRTREEEAQRRAKGRRGTQQPRDTDEHK
jgi:hypothetical protein